MTRENFRTDENYEKVMANWSDYGTRETARRLGIPKHRVASIAKSLGLSLSPAYYENLAKTKVLSQNPRACKAREERAARKAAKREQSQKGHPTAGLLSNGNGTYLLQLKQELSNIENELDNTTDFNRMVELQRRHSTICVRIGNMTKAGTFLSPDII